MNSPPKLSEGYVDRLAGPDPGGKHLAMIAAFGFLEWFFLALLVVLVAATGLFALFLAAQLFRDHARRG